MNLIEAWKQAKDGQQLRLGGQVSLWKNNHNELHMSLGEYIDDNLSELDILADDWEIVKEKKKVVIENTIFKDTPHPECHIISLGNGICNICTKDIPTHKPMKMTLEWEG